MTDYFRDRWQGVGAIAADAPAPRSAPAPNLGALRADPMLRLARRARTLGQSSSPLPGVRIVRRTLTRPPLMLSGLRSGRAPLGRMDSGGDAGGGLGPHPRPPTPPPTPPDGGGRPPTRGGFSMFRAPIDRGTRINEPGLPPTGPVPPPLPPPILPGDIVAPPSAGGAGGGKGVIVGHPDDGGPEVDTIAVLPPSVVDMPPDVPKPAFNAMPLLLIGGGLVAAYFLFRKKKNPSRRRRRRRA